MCLSPFFFLNIYVFFESFESHSQSSKAHTKIIILSSNWSHRDIGLARSSCGLIIRCCIRIFVINCFLTPTIQSNESVLPSEILLLMAKVSKRNLRQFSTYCVIIYQQIQKVERVWVGDKTAVLGIAPCSLKVRQKFLESRIQQQGLTFIIRHAR